MDGRSSTTKWQDGEDSSSADSCEGFLIEDATLRCVTKPPQAMHLRVYHTPKRHCVCVQNTSPLTPRKYILGKDFPLAKICRSKTTEPSIEEPGQVLESMTTFVLEDFLHAISNATLIDWPSRAPVAFSDLKNCSHTADHFVHFLLFCHTELYSSQKPKVQQVVIWINKDKLYFPSLGWSCLGALQHWALWILISAILFTYLLIRYNEEETFLFLDYQIFMISKIPEKYKKSLPSVIHICANAAMVPLVTVLAFAWSSICHALLQVNLL